MRRELLTAVIICLAAILLFLACNRNDEDKDIAPTSNESDDSTGNGQDDDTSCADEDHDGWCRPEDCNDHNPFMNPGRVEDCSDGLDNDCNGFCDQEDSACQGSGQDDDSYY